MFSKENRLKNKRDIDLLFSEGRTRYGQYFFTKVWKIDESLYPKRNYSKDVVKVAIMVGKKVHKSAVKRNKIKRQVRAVIKSLIEEGQIKKGYFVAFVAKPAVVDVDFGDMSEDIRKLARGL